MQQPTSQYYHLVYGGYGELGREDRKFLTRLTYMERPKFKSAGFTDQEFGGFAMVGTNLTDVKKAYGLNTFLGCGRMFGYIAANEADLPKRNYAISGVTLVLEGYLQFYGIDLGIGLQNFTGLVSREEFKTYVAWPYNFYMARLGFYL